MIKVIDAIMGTGKTTGLFNFIRSNPDRKYIYIGAYLREVGDGDTNEEGRIQKELPELNFQMPKTTKDEGKVGGIKYLLSKGCNIASTHSLLSKFDTDVLKLIVDNDYFIIIDEAVDAINFYNGVRQTDLKLLLDKEIIKVDSNDKVIWNVEDYSSKEDGDGVFKRVKELCSLGSLFYFENKVLIWEYPTELLRCAKDILISTYMFDGSIMSKWLEVNNIPYEYADVSTFGVMNEAEVFKQIKDNLDIVVPARLKKLNLKGVACSSTWYDTRCDKEMTGNIKRVLENFMDTNELKVDEVFWTCFIKKQEKLQGKGFTKNSQDKLPAFLTYNAKATNDYADRKACMYAVNIYRHPTEVRYLKSKGINFNQEGYALGMMLQFLWRGCIRKGEKMKALVLSNRMRELLIKWVADDSGLGRDSVVNISLKDSSITEEDI